MSAVTFQQGVAMRYVRNTGGNAKLAHFIEDHEPVGDHLWSDLTKHRFAEERDGKIFLTMLGAAELDQWLRGAF